MVFAVERKVRVMATVSRVHAIDVTTGTGTGNATDDTSSHACTSNQDGADGGRVRDCQLASRASCAEPTDCTVV